MTKFKDIIFEKNVAIHCPEEWMANELLEYADSMGYEWIDGDSCLEENEWYLYFEENEWNFYSEDTCYNIHEGMCGTKDFYEQFRKYNIFHYNDVVIKEDKMETSLEYRLMIKGKDARIGDELWYKDDKWMENIFITGIFVGKSKRRINYFSKNRTGVIDIDSADECLFWEKPIIYQLPDTDGNLSEVKIGQKIYNRELGCWGEIIELNNWLMRIRYHTGLKFSYSITTNNHSKDPIFITNRPKRDFSPYFDWNQAPNGYDYGAIDGNGFAYWYKDKPFVYKYAFFWDCDNNQEGAGFRQNLINPETGCVDDWKDSLVERPKETKQ